MYTNREAAATNLAKEIFTRHGADLDLNQTVVLSIPNGGVVLGHYVAGELTVPHNIIITKKINHPANPNYAIGAISELDDEGIIADLDEAHTAQVADSIQRAKDEILSSKKILRPSHLLTPKLEGKVVILVDEGILTGQTISAAILGVKKQKPAKLIVATPLASRDASDLISTVVDSYVCLNKPSLFMNLANFYDDFPPVSNDQVRRILMGQGN